MRRATFIAIWIVTQIVYLNFALIPLGTTGRVPNRSVCLFEHEDGFEVMSMDAFDHSYQPDSPLFDAEISIVLRTYTGYIRDMKKLDWKAFPIRQTDPNAAPYTQAQLDQIDHAILQYALADPELSRFNPGKPPKYRLSLERMLVSALIFLYLFAPPLLILLFVRSCWRVMIIARRCERVAQRLCVHCRYNCKGLPTPICPECGKPHADHEISTDAGTTSLPESKA